MSDTDNIMMFRLDSGEDIICMVDDETDTHYHIQKPFVLVTPQPNKLGFGNWLAFSTVPLEGLDLPKSYVRLVLTPLDQLVNEYKNAINPGPKVVVPEQPPLVGPEGFKLTQ